MQQQKKSENFSALIYKYRKAALPDSPGDVSDLAAMLESLEAIDQVKSISDQQAIEIILSGLRCIDHQHALSRPFCRLIYNLCFKQVRSNSSFKTSQFDMCIKYILDGLSTVDNQDYKVELLRALSALVFENTQNTQRHADQLADLLLKMANAYSKPLEVRRMAINCIGNTCSSPLSGTQLQRHTEAFYVCLLGNLGVVDQQKTTSSLDFNDTAIRKVASSTLRALRFLLTQDKTLVSHPLCDIIELIYTFIFMHVNVQSYSVGTNHPPTSTVTRRNRLSSQPSIRLPLQLSWRVPLQQKPLSLVTSSESELSDSSMLTELSPRRQRDNAKIRINALLCLCAIATVSPKSLYPHWHKFIPDTFSIFLSNNMNSKDQQLPALLKSDNQPYSLLTILLYDPILNVRSTVCHTLVAILNESKQYLSIASER
ncbi:hypothetical protein BD560DRAFT_456426 [Blakeslea trispora]|nr:hypothetical protein BD560DRAFT_456426 [Blakeslea trispora]